MSFWYWFHESLGLKSSRHVMAWGVAGSIAYVLWVLPAQRETERRKAIVEEWKDKYKNEPGVYTPAYDPEKAASRKAQSNSEMGARQQESS
ncbi:hypothetical protein DUNSADRAFT_4664 [Dunaliella salina]|uniref:Uncharacterized protein n=1 Tax=Dunaliella salina TaxID=3046 RepID=A0ABQ7GRI2_DUNSA|nr:hypothetical protein DUNSADRAFT_4664 [Dunaliella salina]|eukprot:KAF5837209.1 hypothetical protein DUNSADRAFT_4664 [Dunaliella salina]